MRHQTIDARFEIAEALEEANDPVYVCVDCGVVQVARDGDVCDACAQWFAVYGDGDDEISDIDTCIHCGAEIYEIETPYGRYWTHDYPAHLFVPRP